MVRNRFACAARALVLLLGVTSSGVGFGGCGLKSLSRDQLFGSPDAAVAVPDASHGGDGSPEDRATPPDVAADTGDGSDGDGAASIDIAGDMHADADAVPAPDTGGDADGAPGSDATDDGGPGPDAGAAEIGDAPPACTAASCPSDQFCDTTTAQCLPRTGTGMLSGAAYDTCGVKPLDAKVGIAGRHECSEQQKGSFFFTQLPLGKLTVTAAAPGYDLYIQDITVVTGGNTLQIPMVRSAPLTCADPMPTSSICTCTEPGCGPS